MANRDLSELAGYLARDGAMLCFTGSFSQTIIEELGNALRKYLEGEDAQKSSIMDVFSVYIELAQNVRNYGSQLLASEDATAREHVTRSIIVIGKEDGRHVVRAGNAVHRDRLPALVAQLEQVSMLDRAALRTLYKERLKSPDRSAGGGAGLGLIDMARKSSAPLVWAVRPLDDDYSFFSLHVTL